MRVLLIDDRTEDRLPVAEALRAENDQIEVEQVSDALLLARCLEGACPDGVVIDDRLLWSTGLQVAEAVRQQWPAIPQVMLVGDAGARLAALQAGIDEVLLRPTEERKRRRRKKVPDALAELPGLLQQAMARCQGRRSAGSVETRFRDFFQTLPVALYASSGDGVLLDANEAMVRMLGYPDRETLLGTSMRELYYDPDERERWKDQVLEEGVVHGFEARLKRHDGSLIWVRDTASLVRHSDTGTPIFHGYLDDITRERALEKEALLSDHALRESQRALSTLMSTLPGMAYRCRNIEQRTMLLVSPGCLGLTGYAPADLIDNSTVAFGDLIHPDDRSLTWDTIQDALRRQIPFKVEYRVRRVDGQTRIAWERGQGVYDDNDDLLFVEGFISDVTEQRAAAKALSDSEAWYRALFDSAIDVIILTDGELIQDCNPRATEVFGWPVDQLRGQDRRVLSPPQQPDGLSSHEKGAEKVKETLRGRPQQYEWQYQRRDGELFAAEVRLNRVDVGGRTFLQAIIREITDRKQAEAALQRRDEMLRAVSFATARLLQSEDWEGLIDGVLEHFGEAADVSRVYLMASSRRDDGQVFATKLHEWVAPGVAPHEGKPACHLLFPKDVELVRWSEGFSGSAVIHGHTSDFPDTDRQLLDAQEILSLAVVPVFVGGKIWGFMGVDECRKERAWTRGEKEAIRAAADILGGAVQLRRTREMLDIRTRELEVLYRVSELTAGAQQVSAVAEQVVEAICDGCDLDHAALALDRGERDQDGNRLLAVTASCGEVADLPESFPDNGPQVLARAVRTGISVHVPDVRAHPDHPACDERVRAEYAVPLRIGSDTVGVLGCASFSSEMILQWQRRVLDRVATQVAIALRSHP